MAGTTLLATIAIRATRHASASTTRSFLFTRNERSRLLGIYGCLLCLFAMQAPANAQAPTNKWSFQRTGFRTSGTFPQTALSMRSGEAWPVVYAFLDQSLNAYSLFPVIDPKGKHHVQPATNWHQIGAKLDGSHVPYDYAYLQADSGVTGGFAVSAQTASTSAQSSEVVVIGNSTSGFQSPMTGVQAVKFDDNGNPFTASNSLIPNLPQGQKLFDVAISRTGDIGAISQGPTISGALTYWQRSPLLGNAWFSAPLPPTSSPQAPTTDLIFDNASRPHVIGISRTSSSLNVAAFQFDIMTGAWSSSILDTAPGSILADVAAASNDDGILGAAWVNGGTLKYAYLDTNQISPNWVVTSVASTTPTGVPLAPAQGVGLAFDHAGLPVISFVDIQTRQIWVAYDPPSALDGGVTDQPGAEGDFNGDGLVDAYDLDAWSTVYGAEGLGGNDFLAWQRNVTPPPTAAAAIPEPSTLACGVVGSALMLGLAQSKRRQSPAYRTSRPIK